MRAGRSTAVTLAGMNTARRLLIPTIAAWLTYQTLWCCLISWKYGRVTVDTEFSSLIVSLVGVALFCGVFVLVPIGLVRSLWPRAGLAHQSLAVMLSSTLGVTLVLM